MSACIYLGVSICTEKWKDSAPNVNQTVLSQNLFSMDKQSSYLKEAYAKCFGKSLAPSSFFDQIWIFVRPDGFKKLKACTQIGTR